MIPKTHSYQPFVKISNKLLLTTALLAPIAANANQLKWTGADENSGITKWFNTILLVIMAVFTMTACVMGALTFKQLGADGNWKDFWSKIAGCAGMFVVPIAIYWIRDNSKVLP